VFQHHFRNVHAQVLLYKRGECGGFWLVNEIICDPQETVGLTAVLRFGEPRE
jgi:hypothetical protein